MNGTGACCIYPITLRNVPDTLVRLLQDAGVPVQLSQRGTGSNAIEISDGPHDDVGDDLSGISLKIQARDLLPDGVSWAMIDAEAATPVAVKWRECEIWLRESVIREAWTDDVLMKLRRIIIDHGLPWASLAAYPAGYSGLVNFRVDLDEPAPDDWRRVLDALEPLEPAVTWFLSTRAAEQADCIYDWLKGRDVQSHGHWHHVHLADSSLNQSNLLYANQLLKKHGFEPTGFASPCGRMTGDLPAILNQLQYQYLAGIGDLCGSMPRRMADGLWRVNTLPVSEGLYLEENIHDVDAVVEGYLSMARRALDRGRPLFWYGHAERRLGRKPAILHRLVREIENQKGLWHVTLGQYLQWLESRRLVEIKISREPDRADQFQIESIHANLAQQPLLHLENQHGRWSVAINHENGENQVTLDPAECSSIPQSTNPPELQLQDSRPGLKHWLREKLDWERETPVEMLRGGPLLRRAKGLLRARTDKAWQAKFQPRAWAIETRDEPGRDVA